MKYNYLETFENVDDEIKAYILGLFWADGWLSSDILGIRLQTGDRPLLEKIKKYISPEVTIQLDKKKISNAIYFCNADIIKNFRKLGFDKKEFRNFIPSIPSNLLSHFIRGYFDGDGTVLKDRNAIRANICGVDLDFLNKIKEILKENDIDSCIALEKRFGKSILLPQGNYKEDCKDMYRLYVNRKLEVFKFKEWLYKDASIYLERKFKVFDLPVNPSRKKALRQLDDNFNLIKVFPSIRQAEQALKIKTGKLVNALSKNIFKYAGFNWELINL